MRPPPPVATLDPTTLTAYRHAAAGHDGSLADPSGALFIKPCTRAETAFYEDAARLHPRLAALMPVHLGTLELAPPALAAAAAAHAERDGAATEGGPAAAQQQVDQLKHQPFRLKALPIQTSTHLVLANAAAHLARPNVLDVKLGARLWAPGTPAAKRARLDAVADASTSRSLGFRIAGMRVWLGDRDDGDGGGRSSGDHEGRGNAASAGEQAPAAEEPGEAGDDEFSRYERATNTRFFHKFYGRRFAADNVIDGLREFVRPSHAGSPAAVGLLDARMTARVASLFLDGVREVREVLEEVELRVFSSSLLLVYEADARAFAAKEKAMEERALLDRERTAGRHGGGEGDGLDENDDDDDDKEEDGEDDDEEEEEEDFTLATVKFIDFAHARFAPGEGPDENVLQGVRNVERLLGQLVDELRDPAPAIG